VNFNCFLYGFPTSLVWYIVSLFKTRLRADDGTSLVGFYMITDIHCTAVLSVNVSNVFNSFFYF